MKWLIGFAVVNVMTKLDFVATVDVLVTLWLFYMMLHQRMVTRFSGSDNVLSLVSLVNIAMTRSMPHCQLTLSILGITVVQVYKQLLKMKLMISVLRKTISWTFHLHDVL